MQCNKYYNSEGIMGPQCGATSAERLRENFSEVMTFEPSLAQSWFPGPDMVPDLQ